MKKSYLLGLALIGSLGALMGGGGHEVKAGTPPHNVAQAKSSSCVALQEVTSGQTQIRKLIKIGFFGPGNINTDFSVPSTETFDFYVVKFTPENDANYRASINFRYADGSEATGWSDSGDVTRDQLYTRRVISPIEEQPFLVNISVSGQNNTAYTVAVEACR
jgi:hypothetical protein